MGIDTSPSKPWGLAAGALIFSGSVLQGMTLRDPIPPIGIPVWVFLVIGLGIAAVLAFDVFGPERSWTRTAGMTASVIGLGMAALMAAGDVPGWPLLLIGVGSSVGLVALYLERRRGAAPAA